MIKSLSVALLAVSMLTAPALAAGTQPAKPTAPIGAKSNVVKPQTAKLDAAKSEVAKPQAAKADVMKSRAELVRPHHRHVVRHHRLHKHVASHKLHRHVQLHHAAKLTVQPAHAARRG